jgi:hypothetical protein
MPVSPLYALLVLNSRCTHRRRSPPRVPYADFSNAHGAHSKQCRGTRACHCCEQQQLMLTAPPLVTLQICRSAVRRSHCNTLKPCPVLLAPTVEMPCRMRSCIMQQAC